MAKSPGDKQLPTTAYAVLGLVSFGETSGYDLKQFADRSINYFFWSPATSQIYAELRRLKSLGYVREREVEQERRPDKRLYRITEDGEDALRNWLARPEASPDVIKSTLLLTVFLGRLVPVETLIAQLEGRRRQAQAALSEFEEIQRQIKDNEEYFFPYLTLRCGMANCRATIVWAEDAIEELRRRDSSGELHE